MIAFANEPVLELRRAPHRDALLAALQRLDARLPVRVPVLIGAARRDADDALSHDPGDPSRVVAIGATATAADVPAAVEAAQRGFRSWSRTPAAERAQALVAAAAWLRERRHEAAALAVREAGKPWGEADADICEAIDFLEYYARGAVELERGGAIVPTPGERNELHYRPRGVVAVISPWNFPLAIPLGMVAAGLATGNAVVLKPAEQAPGCAAMVVEALRAGGVPADCISLLPGEGDVGAALVRHPGVHTIAFTGSGPVGLDILRAAAETPPGSRHLKNVVSEMGGKNCIVVDADADLDDAVPGIVRSAFAYAGQKCSAASRVLVHEAIADTLTERLAGAVATLRVGQADTFGIDVPPVIEADAQARVRRYAEAARAAGTLVAAQADGVADHGWFCAPTVVAGLPADAPVLREEVFGPLLTLEAVQSVDDACDRIDELPFALTQGLYARNPHTVDHVVRRSPVGNLYVNRTITGAMVGRQPFGGNRLSGTGTKAGGPGYLLQFVEPRVVTENTVRHGLVV